MQIVMHHCLILRGWLALVVLLGAAHVANAEDHSSYARIVERARQNALRDLGTLRSYLYRGGPEVLAGWDEHLNLGALQHELSQPTPDLDQVTLLWHKFYAPDEGLENAAFLKARDSLRVYRLLAAMPPGELKQLQEGTLAKVRTGLEAYQQSDHRDDVHEVGQLLAWLSATGADPNAIAAARRPYLQPNAYIRVSSQLANHFLNRDVTEQERITATIGGATTTANALTKGKLWLHTAPESNRGAIDIRLTGNIVTSDSVTQRGRITIYGGATTSINARVRLNVDDDLLRVLPPEVHCETKTRIDDIVAPRRVVERLAWRRAPRELPEAEAEAARQAEKRLSERLSEETTSLLEDANNLYAKKVRLPFTRRGAWPQLRYSTDSESLHLRWLQLDGYQLAASTRPPQWPVAGDLTLAGHESMPENMLESLFGGREIRDTQFLYMHELMTGEAPRALWVHDREPRWSVIVSELRPLRLRFRDGRMQLTMAIDRTLRGDDSFDTPAHVSATFVVDATEDGPVIRRQGNISVEFPDSQTPSDDREQLRSFLTRKFNAVMPAELHFDGLTAPAGGFGDKLNQLRLQGVDFQQGWATIRYQLDPTRKPKQELVSTSGLGSKS